MPVTRGEGSGNEGSSVGLQNGSRCLDKLALHLHFRDDNLLTMVRSLRKGVGKDRYKVHVHEFSY